MAARASTRYLLVAVLAGAAILVFASDLDRYLTLDALREHRQSVTGFAQANRLEALFLFALIYIATVALSLPGATMLTLAGGFLFGPWLAGSVVVVSATIGAVIIFLAARTAFADSLKARAGPWLERLQAGFRDNAASYMLVLRLVPLFPFFIVNVAPAFLGVSTRVFAVTTFIGIIPGTFIYAGLGNGLGAILDAGAEPDLGIIFRWEILGPLLGLAAFALLPVIHRRFKARDGSHAGQG